MTFDEIKKEIKKKKKINGGLIYIYDENDAAFIGTDLPYRLNKKISKLSKEMITIIENNQTIEGRCYTKEGETIFSDNIEILANIYAAIGSIGEIKKKEHTKTKVYIEINLNSKQEEALKELKEKYSK